MSKEETRAKIKEILKFGMKDLLGKISGDFKGNYERKVHNWTLAKFDSVLVAHMVFVSSFESKSGNMFQSIAKEIAKIRYGVEGVPKVIKGRGVNDEEFERLKSNFEEEGQVVMTKIDQSACLEFLTEFREVHKGSGRGHRRRPPSLNQETLKEINNHTFKETDSITSKPIDLAIYDSEKDTYYFMEIKAGGDLDSSNAPGNVAKMLTEFAICGKDNVKLYFATLYNKNGEGNPWTGYIKGYLSDDMLLIGQDFWKRILPEDISFEDLKEIYNEISDELDANNVINNLLSGLG
jgi:hypothetical protein